MVKLYEDGIYLRGGSEVVPAAEAAERGITQTPEDAKRGTCLLYTSDAADE